MWGRGRGINFQKASSSSSSSYNRAAPVNELISGEVHWKSKKDRLDDAKLAREKEQEYFLHLEKQRQKGGPEISPPGPKLGTPSGSTGLVFSSTFGRKRHLDEDESYWEQEEEKESNDQLPYQPAPGSPGAQPGEKDKEEEENDDDDDPLDAYMAGIEVQARKDKDTSEKKEKEKGAEKDDESEPSKKKKEQLGRTDIDEEDMQESYFNFLEERKNAHGGEEEEEIIEYDEEGNPIITKKLIDPLPAIDHEQVDYESFDANFYHEHTDISSLTEQQVGNLRAKLGLKVTGFKLPKPISSFAHFGFDKHLMACIRKFEFVQPTPIQAQGIPAALSGRDVIGIAKTGSGKTAAYLWPAVVHVMHQRELEENEGAIVLILVPTRELAIQVYNEAKKVGKIYDLRVVCAYGGGSKWEQTKALGEGAEIIVATPGRMIDVVKIGATNLKRVTFLVFDEADRMFDLGFEAQVHSIANHVRPDRQCLLFSATFKKKVERLARDTLKDPVRIVQGELGEANEDVVQIVEVLHSGAQKWPWLLQRLVGFCSMGKVLVFVTRKLNCDALAANLKMNGQNLGMLHGDILQHERNEVLQKFRKGDTKILIATDVAARGLDIPEIRNVVNYDIARDIDTHVHRIGRTGRAGNKGWAYTLVVPQDKEFAGHLVRNLESVGQPVSKALLDLANQASWFRSQRQKQNNAAKPAIGGAGLGYKRALKAGPTGGSSKSAETAVTGALNLRDALRQLHSSGPTDRLTAMKSAFSVSYKSTFTKSFETMQKEAEEEAKKAEQKARKKTRWE